MNADNLGYEFRIFARETSGIWKAVVREMKLDETLKSHQIKEYLWEILLRYERNTRTSFVWLDEKEVGVSRVRNRP